MNNKLKQSAINRILSEIYETNRFYVKTGSETLKKNLSKPQQPVATLVMCCDSRAHTTSFTYKPENNFFIVRNIGNQYILNQGSVEYGVKILKTKLLIFLGHSQCGAIKASMNDYSDLPSSIVREVDHLTLSIKKTELSGDDECKWHQAVINNINKQVELAMKDFDALVAKKTLTIIGMVLDIDNSSGSGIGKIDIINYNGITNTQKLKSIELIAQFFNE